MAVYPVLAATLIMKVVAVIFFICALLLILIVLIQKGKGGGLSAAFGGGTASGILGAKTKEPLTWFTIILAGVFLTFGVILAKYYKPGVSAFEVEQAATTRQGQPEEAAPAVEGDLGETSDVNESVNADLPEG